MQSAMQRARVILIGSGRMGQIRAKAVYSNPRFELIGIVDSNVDAAMKLAEMYRVSTQWRESVCVCVFISLSNTIILILMLMLQPTCVFF